MVIGINRNPGGCGTLEAAEATRSEAGISPTKIFTEPVRGFYRLFGEIAHLMGAPILDNRMAAQQEDLFWHGVSYLSIRMFAGMSIIRVWTAYAVVSKYNFHFGEFLSQGLPNQNLTSNDQPREISFFNGEIDGFRNR